MSKVKTKRIRGGNLQNVATRSVSDVKNVATRGVDAVTNVATKGLDDAEDGTENIFTSVFNKVKNTLSSTGGKSKKKKSKKHKSKKHKSKKHKKGGSSSR